MSGIGKHIDSGVRSTDMDLASADSSHLLPELPSDPDTMVTILEKITVLFERYSCYTIRQFCSDICKSST